MRLHKFLFPSAPLTLSGEVDEAKFCQAVVALDHPFGLLLRVAFGPDPRGAIRAEAARVRVATKRGLICQTSASYYQHRLAAARAIVRADAVALCKAKRTLAGSHSLAAEGNETLRQRGLFKALYTAQL